MIKIGINFRFHHLQQVLAHFFIFSSKFLLTAEKDLNELRSTDQTAILVVVSSIAAKFFSNKK